MVTIPPMMTSARYSRLSCFPAMPKPGGGSEATPGVDAGPNPGLGKASRTTWEDVFPNLPIDEVAERLATRLKAKIGATATYEAHRPLKLHPGPGYIWERNPPE